MEDSTSRILIETVVRKTLEDIRESPERNLRNLVDMALHFSEGKFQHNFFQAAQTMLQNENSPYYALLRNVISSVDPERLVCFGMNLGYNSCITGAKKIRENERAFGFNIPWTASLQINGAQLSEHLTEYHTAITEGETLGIYAWSIFAQTSPQSLLSLINAHPDSAFFLFCEPADISESFLDSIADTNNVMLVVHYEENAGMHYARLREAGLLYSVYYNYSEKDIDIITNGDLFYSIQQVHPIFTILLAAPDCPDLVRRSVHQLAEQARNEQSYQTFPWEFHFDNQTIDKIISDDICSARFDQYGNLYDWTDKNEGESYNLFKNGLFIAFKCAYPKNKKTVKSRQPRSVQAP